MFYPQLLLIGVRVGSCQHPICDGDGVDGANREQGKANAVIEKIVRRSRNRLNDRK